VQRVRVGDQEVRVQRKADAGIATPQQYTWSIRKPAETFNCFIFSICASCSIEQCSTRAQPAHVDAGVAVAVNRQLPALARAVDGLRMCQRSKSSGSSSLRPARRLAVAVALRGLNPSSPHAS
jgi:hypothetical protein